MAKIVIGNCPSCTFSTLNPNAPPSVVGECRRYAPKFATEFGQATRIWPVVQYDDWCGEFIEDDKYGP